LILVSVFLPRLVPLTSCQSEPMEATLQRRIAEAQRAAHGNSSPVIKPQGSPANGVDTSSSTAPHGPSPPLEPGGYAPQQMPVCLSQVIGIAVPALGLSRCSQFLVLVGTCLSQFKVAT